MRRLTVLATAAMLVLIPACQLQQPQDSKPGDSGTEETKVLPPLHLGAVHQVYPQQGFALLRMIGPIPPGGSVLITHPMDGSNSRMGNLIVSSEYNSRGNIIAADIRSGEVVKGDRVFLYRNILSQVEEEESDTETTPTVRPILDTVSDEAVEAALRAEAGAVPEQETAPEPEQPIEEPVTPAPSATPSVEIPSYLDEIPDEIHGWH